MGYLRLPALRADIHNSPASPPRDTIPPNLLRSLRPNFTLPTSRRKKWRPNSLRPSTLIITTLFTWLIIGILIYLLRRSQRDSGIMFAPRINDLPLSKTFTYQHLPTMLAVVYSIWWAWIDLETKRLEPFYQLSNDDGALGKDSLLLHYPFDFIPLVPIRALRNRHWVVFCASLAVLLVTWGIVPTQAGIFAVSEVTRNFTASFRVSDAYMNAAEQRNNLSLRYAQSVYGIVTQREKLPAYMSEGYALAPFEPSDLQEKVDGEFKEEWIAMTTLYSVDVKCEEAKRGYDSESRSPYVESSEGCRRFQGSPNNETVGSSLYDDNWPSDLNSAVKDYSSIYVGFGDLNASQIGLNDWHCKADQVNPHTFYVSFIHNKAKPTDPPGNSTELFCVPQYYSREASMRVDAANRLPHQRLVSEGFASPPADLGPKKDLSTDVFDIKRFEIILNAAAMRKEIRGALPTLDLPSYMDNVGTRNITILGIDYQGPLNSLHPMAALALLLDNRSLQDYLEPSKLKESYEAAYRMMFSRAMVEVLSSNNFSSSHTAIGHREITSQALIIVPVFVYIVVCLLAIVSIASLGMLIFTMKRKLNLTSNPATIAALMSLSADEQPLLADIARLDATTIDDMARILGNQRYRMIDNDLRNAILQVTQTVITDTAGAPEINTNTDSAQRVRSVEFRWFMVMPFVALHAVLAIVLAVLQQKTKPNGLPLPSQNKIVESLLENYIPTAVATLIEPMWILINRLLCLLQPLEELRRGRAQARASIDLDYASLPPQLTIFKALRSRHFVLAAVCSMALLANILAVAFAGLFNHNIKAISKPAIWRQLYEPKFVALDGSIGPDEDSKRQRKSGAFRGGQGTEQFLIAESNYTSGTAMPAWMDSNMMYLPFQTESTSEIRQGNVWIGRTHAFGAEIDCSPQKEKDNYTARIYIPDTSPPSVRLNFSSSVRSASGEVVTCSTDVGMNRGPSTGDEFKYACQKGLVAAEFVLLLEPRENATKEEIDTCAGRVAFGWVRRGGGTCFPSLNANTTLNDDDSLFIGCKPKLKIGEATIKLGSDARLTEPASEIQLFDLTTQEQAKYFGNDSINVISQSNRYLFVDHDESTWHNDTFATQMFNHFIRHRNGSRLLDPNYVLPTFDEAYQPLRETYSYLFATWLAVNYESLFTRYLGPEESAPQISGSTLFLEERLFLSTPMFVIAEVILCCYAFVAIVVYLRRPGAYLARLPTCVASIIALFASSAAVEDMRDTSRYSKKERSRHLDKLNQSYAYGSYVGGDGGVHIGIEKSHLVNILATRTWLEKKMKTSQKK